MTKKLPVKLLERAKVVLNKELLVNSQPVIIYGMPVTVKVIVIGAFCLVGVAYGVNLYLSGRGNDGKNEATREPKDPGSIPDLGSGFVGPIPPDESSGSKDPEDPEDSGRGLN